MSRRGDLIVNSRPKNNPLYKRSRDIPAAKRYSGSHNDRIKVPRVQSVHFDTSVNTGHKVCPLIPNGMWAHIPQDWLTMMVSIIEVVDRAIKENDLSIIYQLQESQKLVYSKLVNSFSSNFDYKRPRATKNGLYQPERSVNKIVSLTADCRENDLIFPEEALFNKRHSQLDDWYLTKSSNDVPNAEFTKVEPFNILLNCMMSLPKNIQNCMKNKYGKDFDDSRLSEDSNETLPMKNLIITESAFVKEVKFKKLLESKSEYFSEIVAVGDDMDDYDDSNYSEFNIIYLNTTKNDTDESYGVASLDSSDYFQSVEFQDGDRLPLIEESQVKITDVLQLELLKEFSSDININEVLLLNQKTMKQDEFGNSYFNWQSVKLKMNTTNFRKVKPNSISKQDSLVSKHSYSGFESFDGLSFTAAKKVDKKEVKIDMKQVPSKRILTDKLVEGRRKGVTSVMKKSLVARHREKALPKERVKGAHNKTSLERQHKVERKCLWPTSSCLDSHGNEKDDDGTTESTFFTKNVASKILKLKRPPASQQSFLKFHGRKAVAGTIDPVLLEKRRIMSKIRYKIKSKKSDKIEEKEDIIQNFLKIKSKSHKTEIKFHHLRHPKIVPATTKYVREQTFSSTFNKDLLIENLNAQDICKNFRPNRTSDVEKLPPYDQRYYRLLQ